MAVTGASKSATEILKGLGFVDPPGLAPVRPQPLDATLPAAASAVATRARVEQIDAMRFVAFCTVTTIHVIAVDTRELNAHGLLLMVLRYSLAFFFMTSGFMAGLKATNGLDYGWRVFKRLFVLFVAWELVYNGVHFWVHDLGYHPSPSSIPEPYRHLIATLNGGGVAFHLWFLPWLGVSIAIFLALRPFGWRAVWTVSLALYAIGLAVGPYNEMTGVFSWVARIYPDAVAFTGRNGPFFGPLFVAMGAWFAARRDEVPAVPVSALAIFVAIGLSLFVWEAMFISAHGVKPISNFNFLLGSAIFSPALFLLVLRVPIGRMAGRVARLGRFAVGMYCIHGLFTLGWAMIVPPATRLSVPIATSLAVSAAIVVASAIMAVGLAKVPGLKRLVS